MTLTTELFQPGSQLNNIAYNRTGFADYDLTVITYEYGGKRWSFLPGTLQRGSLSLDLGFYGENPTELFTDRVMGDWEIAQVRETLSELPEYVKIEAAVLFPEDMTMAQIRQFIWDNGSSSEYPATLVWAAIRNCGPKDNMPVCGFNPHTYGDNSGLAEQYPDFFIMTHNPDGSDLERHFKGILKFSSDQYEKGEGIMIWPDGENYYDLVLEYVEENGVMGYGGVVNASPQTLAHLLDNGVITQLEIWDSWLDVG